MTKIESLAAECASYGKIECSLNESLAPHSSFKIGGRAALFAEPSDTDSLCFLLNAILEKDIPYFILGGGTNVLFSDAGFDGAVVSTGRLTGIGLRAAPDQGRVILSVGAGTKTNTLVNYAAGLCISGLEEFAGLPGTVGGAAYMNARCFEREISDIAGKITWIELDPAQKKFVQHEGEFKKSDWDYKKSPFTGSGRIITRAEFLLKKAAPAEKSAIEEKCRAFVLQRKEKGHYSAPCAGSVFKNNRAFGRPTGKIIEELGLKGTEIGGAQIAPFHGNIIINKGGAKAADVLALIRLCKEKASERFGIALEEEIIFP